jgi:hypothetical protein
VVVASTAMNLARAHRQRIGGDEPATEPGPELLPQLDA